MRWLFLLTLLVFVAAEQNVTRNKLALVVRGESFVRTPLHGRASMHSVPEQYDAVRSHTMYIIPILKKLLRADTLVIYLESARPHLDSLLKTWYSPYKTHSLLPEDVEESISLHAREIAAVICLRANVVVPASFGHYMESSADLEKIIWAELGILYLPGEIISKQKNFLHLHSLQLKQLQKRYGAENITIFT